MKAKVLLSSGDLDWWHDIEDVNMREDGALIITQMKNVTLTEKMLDLDVLEPLERSRRKQMVGTTKDIEFIIAIYAPGMWMRVEIDRD